MSVTSRLRDLLPPPLTTAADSIVMRLLDVAALELDAVHEDHRASSANALDQDDRAA
ncbi:MAG: hypothetical protein QM736_22510 [Vicinamibacterales bacterium]